MGERIKRLRKSLDLTQQEFADRIGCSRNNIANYETSHRNPSSAVINNICKTFNVNEVWLRTGDGEMFNPKASFSLDEYAQSVGATALELELVKILLGLPPDIRSQMMNSLREAVKATENKTESVFQAPPPEPAAPDVIAMLTELQRQNAELLRQNQELMRRDAKRAADIEALKKEDADAAYVDELSSLFFSTPESSDAEKAKTQETAHQHDR